MPIAAVIVVAIVAALHTGFFVLESLLWTTPTGRKVFQLTREKAAETRALAANQGLYNLFLAAGLVWSILASSPALAVFFLACVTIAGIVGALTVNKRIFLVQGLPAIVGLVLVHLR